MPNPVRDGRGSTLYLEPFSGIAGDMLLAALLDLRDPRFTLEDLRALAQALVPGECSIETERAWRGSLSGLLLTVRTPESSHAPHRHLADLEAIVRRSPLTAAMQTRALAVFRRIAEAEARVHGTTVEEIHFHEVGAVDALVDVCGAAFAIGRLQIASVRSSPPLAGTGTVHCAHGEMPVPAPGTAEILRGLPVALAGGSGERVTPTGAALLAEYVERFEPPALFVARAIGYGAGHRDPKDGPPNVLRVQLGDEVVGGERAIAWLMELNLDDMTGEEIGFLVQGLREAGALEAWTAPVQMKKDRPGVVVSALCREDKRAALEDKAFALSTTLGVRWSRRERTECRRESFEVEVLGRRVRIQRRIRPGDERRASGEADLSPEYDDLAKLAREAGISLREAERLALEAAVASPAARGSE